MDAADKMDDQAAQPVPEDVPEGLPLNEAQADAVLEQNRKRGTSGLSWDEVAADDENGWRRATEMGEGD